MTKGELRRARKDAAASGQGWQVDIESGRPVMVRTRTRREEAAHQRAMNRWARRYDALNGAPEGIDDR